MSFLGTPPPGRLGAGVMGNHWHEGLAGDPTLLCPQVQWLEQQVAKRRTKRDVFMEPTDPKFPQQWYLVSVR